MFKTADFGNFSLPLSSHTVTTVTEPSGGTQPNKTKKNDFVGFVQKDSGNQNPELDPGSKQGPELKPRPGRKPGPEPGREVRVGPDPG